LQIRPTGRTDRVAGVPRRIAQVARSPPNARECTLGGRYQVMCQRHP
jgi:hypothetical protein